MKDYKSLDDLTNEGWKVVDTIPEGSGYVMLDKGEYRILYNKYFQFEAMRWKRPDYKKEERK